MPAKQSAAKPPMKRVAISEEGQKWQAENGVSEKARADRAEKNGLPLGSPPQLSEAANRWIEENAEAIRSSNEYVEKHGLPLAKYRMF